MYWSRFMGVADKKWERTHKHTRSLDMKNVLIDHKEFSIDCCQGAVMLIKMIMSFNYNIPFISYQISFKFML